MLAITYIVLIRDYLIHFICKDNYDIITYTNKIILHSFCEKSCISKCTLHTKHDLKYKITTKIKTIFKHLFIFLLQNPIIYTYLKVVMTF